MAFDRVTLRKEDGSLIALPKEKLSKADIAYIESLRKAPRRRSQEPPSPKGDTGRGALSFQIVYTANQRYDKALTYYVLVDELDLRSPSLKENVRNVIKKVCEKSGDKLDIEVHDNRASLDNSYRQNGDMSLGRPLTPEELSTRERHLVAHFSGHLETGTGPHELAFFPGAFTSSPLVGHLVGFQDFDPLK